MKKNLLYAVTVLMSFQADAINLDGTIFEAAGKKHNIDPALIYSVALAESASGRGDNKISPWPWTLRAPGKPVYAKTHEQAKKELSELRRLHGGAIDVGFMQVNLRWHGHRVTSVYELLEPETNVMIGTQILSEAISSSPEDPVLGIGRYHTWQDEARARNYGSRVLAIYRNLSGE